MFKLTVNHEKYTPLGIAFTIHAYCTTPAAEQKLISSIWQSGYIKDVMIKNRKADGLYTLRVVTRMLMTPRGLQKRIARSIVEYDVDSQEGEFSSRCGKKRDICRYLLLGL